MCCVHRLNPHRRLGRTKHAPLGQRCVGLRTESEVTCAPHLEGRSALPSERGVGRYPANRYRSTTALCTTFLSRLAGGGRVSESRWSGRPRPPECGSSAGGLQRQRSSIVASDGTITDGPVPETKAVVGGFRPLRWLV